MYSPDFSKFSDSLSMAEKRHILLREALKIAESKLDEILKEKDKEFAESVKRFFKKSSFAMEIGKIYMRYEALSGKRTSYLPLGEANTPEKVAGIILNLLFQNYSEGRNPSKPQE